MLIKVGDKYFLSCKSKIIYQLHNPISEVDVCIKLAGRSVRKEVSLSRVLNAESLYLECVIFLP